MNATILLGMVAWHPSLNDMVHVAHVLYLSSYLVRDIVWLRLLTVVAGLSLLLDKNEGRSFKLRAALGRDVVAKLRAHDEPTTGGSATRVSGSANFWSR